MNKKHTFVEYSLSDRLSAGMSLRAARMVYGFKLEDLVNTINDLSSKKDYYTILRLYDEVRQYFPKEVIFLDDLNIGIPDNYIQAWQRQKLQKSQSADSQYTDLAKALISQAPGASTTARQLVVELGVSVNIAKALSG